MEFEKVMLSRKSCRAYTDKPVEEEKLEKVILAGSMAPLGLPRVGVPALTVVTDKDALAKLNNFYNAPVVILVSCPEYPAPGIDHQNAACVVEMISLMATELGLGNIYLYGVTAQLGQNAELMKEFSIPEGFKPLAALALGYGEEEIAVCKELVAKLPMNRI